MIEGRINIFSINQGYGSKCNFRLKFFLLEVKLLKNFDTIFTVDPRDTSLIRSVTVLVTRNARMPK